MSALEVLLGEPCASLKLPDGRTWTLHPLRLPEIAKLQKHVGIPGNMWTKQEFREKLYEVETIGFILWLSLRRNPECSALTHEAVLELFGFADLDALVAAVNEIMRASGVMAKNPPRATEASAVAP